MRSATAPLVRHVYRNHNIEADALSKSGANGELFAWVSPSVAWDKLRYLRVFLDGSFCGDDWRRQSETQAPIRSQRPHIGTASFRFKGPSLSPTGTNLCGHDISPDANGRGTLSPSPLLSPGTTTDDISAKIIQSPHKLQTASNFDFSAFQFR